MVMVCQGTIQSDTVEICIFQYGVIQQGKICYCQLTPKIHLDFCVCIVQYFEEINFFSSLGFDRCACYSSLLPTLFYKLAVPPTSKTPYDCVKYVVFARCIFNRPRAAVKTKNPQALRKGCDQVLSISSELDKLC